MSLLYRSLVRSDTLIGRYMDYMQDQETSETYDFWCALWLISLAVGRNIYVDRPRAPVYLNLYSILVAESGITRKTSAVRAAQRIAYDFLDDSAQMGVIEGKISPERFDAVLHERSLQYGHASVCLCISELATFLGLERYVQTMPALLTDVYDCPDTRRVGGTNKSGSLEQQQLFVSMLAASTPSWLLKSINPNVIEGGFTSRCMFVISDKPKKRIAWPEIADDGSVPRINIMVEHMKHMQAMAYNYKTIGINANALKAFRNWYTRRKPSADAYRASFESREDAHILRVAAFLCINDDSWILQSSHLRLALRIVAEVKHNAHRLFSNMADGRSKIILGIEQARIMLLSSEQEPVPRSKLWLRCRRHLRYEEFTAMLETMHDAGAIQRFTIREDGGGRPADLIRATKSLADRSIVSTLADRMY